MMGYISINPKLHLYTWLLETLMLGCDIDLNYVCTLGCWEEPDLSPGVLKRTYKKVLKAVMQGCSQT